MAKVSSWQPTQKQMQLLRVVSGSEAIALEAWQAWRHQVDLDTLDDGSYQLLPRLYCRLQQLNVTDEMLPRLKGVYRHVWSRNQVNLHNLSTAISALNTHHITPGLLWGTATVSHPGADLGICRTDDGGLWVRSDDLPVTLATLKRLGWIPAQKKAATELRSQQHAVGIQHPNGANLTLHWHPLPAFRPIAERLWQQIQPVPLGPAQACLPDPTTQFLLSCVRATRWGKIPPFHWLATAVELSSEVDIQQLRQQAQDCRLTYALQQALTLIVELDPALTSLLSELQLCPISRFEQTELRVYGGPPRYGSLPALWFQWVRLRSPELPDFVTFLQHRWGLSQPWQVPTHLLKRSSQRLYHSLRAS
ncbi:MAG: nucleotidyltransferase family protein [Cyanobacteria bacterium J06632_22]